MTTLVFQTPLTREEDKVLKKRFTNVVKNRIRDLRKQRGLTQQKLSDLAGLHLTYVGHLELGRYRPSMYVLWKIASALKVPLDEFVKE